MRFILAVVLAGLLLGCDGSPETLTSVNGLEPTASLNGTDLQPAATQVVINAWDSEGRLGKREQDHTITLNQTHRGVAVAFDSPRDEIGGAFRGQEEVRGRQPPVASGISLSDGFTMFDGNGAPVATPDLASLREASGLPRETANPITHHPTSAPTEGPRRYTDQTITASRTARDLMGLREYSDEEERIAPGRILFKKTEESGQQTWLFDETLGAVVEASVMREGHLYLSITNHFRELLGRTQLEMVRFAWFSPDGEVVRRVTHHLFQQ